MPIWTMCWPGSPSSSSARTGLPLLRPRFEVAQVEVRVKRQQAAAPAARRARGHRATRDAVVAAEQDYRGALPGLQRAPLSRMVEGSSESSSAHRQVAEVVARAAAQVASRVEVRRCCSGRARCEWPRARDRSGRA